MIPHSMGVLEYPIKAIPPQNACSGQEGKRKMVMEGGTANEKSLNAK